MSALWLWLGSILLETDEHGALGALWLVRWELKPED